MVNPGIAVPDMVEKRNVGPRGASEEASTRSMNCSLRLFNSLEMALALALEDELKLLGRQVMLPVPNPDLEVRAVVVLIDGLWDEVASVAFQLHEELAIVASLASEPIEVFGFVVALELIPLGQAVLLQRVYRFPIGPKVLVLRRWL